MENKKKKIPSLQSFCAILPSDQQTLSQDVFQITETDVICPDTKFENSSHFNFQHVFNGIRDLQLSFEKYYAPLVKQAAAGESTLLTFCGPPISNSAEYFTSVNGRIGFISLAAQLLLRAAIVDGQNPGTVTLSWYKVECGNTESIVDLLRSSSPLHNHKLPDPNLILRELGKGRGMIVPGLWEVELNTPQDVDAVINHVHRMYPTSHHDGLSHSVFQFTISPHDIQAKIANNKTGSKTTVNDDSPGVGRLTIVLLSNLSEIKNLSYTEPLITPASSTVPPALPIDSFPWVHLANDILHWMESRRPSPPFHKSRILLLLRDSLCLRMPSIFTLFLSPTVVDLPDNSSWLHLVTRISHITQDRFNANYTIRQVPLTTNQSTNLRESAMIVNGTESNNNTTHITPKKDLNDTRHLIVGESPPKSGNSKRNISPIAKKEKYSRNSNSGGSSFDDKILNQNGSQINYGRLPRGTDLEEFKSQPQDYFTHTHDQSFSISSLQSEKAPQHNMPSHSKSGQRTKDPEKPRSQQKAISQNIQGPHNPNRSPNPPPPPPSLIFNKEKKKSPVSPINSSARSPTHSPPSSPKAGNPHIIYVPTLPEGAMDAEGAHALIASLEALRNEVNTLRHALAVSQQSATYYKEECRKLSDFHREEGSTLKVQDRAKLKSTLQDLKDYEVYREVMESAMTRMQNEMDSIVKENAEMNEVQKQLEKELRKVKSQQSKYQKDIEVAQKSRKDLARKLEVTEEQLRNVIKEKEISVSTLSQFKSEKSRELGELNTNSHKKDVELKSLKKKVIELESKLQSTVNEYSATSILHDQELNKLRTAHSKSLEMLMSYQEENELLRSAMADLVEKQQQNHDQHGSDEEFSSPMNNLEERDIIKGNPNYISDDAEGEQDDHEEIED